MKTGITEKGKEIFGRWVAKCRLQPSTRARVVEWLDKTNPSEFVGDIVTQDQFARWVTAQSGLRVSGGAIGRVERGNYRGAPALETIAALTLYLEILQFPDGHYCSIEEAINILCGELDPFAGEKKSGKTLKKR
jgi:hypothetical protein